MARPLARSPQTRRATRLDFVGLEIVGALMTPDMVARIAAFDASDQTEEDYGVPPGLKLREEIARFYRIGEALWARFQTARLASPLASERFTLDLLRQCFGFDTLASRPPKSMGDRGFPIRHAALDGRIPIVIAPAAAESARRPGIEDILAQFADGTRRRSATLLLQEYLNAAPDTAWGIASDGQTLRLLRDNVSLTRPAWIEANLARIFGEGLFAEFSALWLLIHHSRFGTAGVPATDCALERWRDRGRVEGVVARDKLRQGVEAALRELGQGFVEHPGNIPLREALADGTLTPQGYYEELLRLVYRLIFLFAAEDRGLLHPPEASESARQIYAEGYALTRLRERATRRATWDRHGDSWEGLKTSFTALQSGEPRLALPALGGMFARDMLPNLERSRIENRRLLAAIWRLAWLRPEGQPLTRVNWRDMETEELGSVYESLLELTPLASAAARIFDFAEGDETRGNARKTSGSYYTPDALVKLLLDQALDPVLDAAEARNPADPAGEILKLSIIDPACGSGHFLLAAARRAAGRIARLRSPGAPDQGAFQRSLREVVSHCVYGVDRNPMAVELCKVALWIEALEPGKPLTFLDSHIRCGDSLVGVFDYETLRRGIPDEAYESLTGDDKAAAKAWAKHNKQRRDGKGTTGFYGDWRPPAGLIDEARALVDMPEDTLVQVAAKRLAFGQLHSGAGWLGLKTACDLYVAAFFVPKTGAAPEAAELARPMMPLTDHVWMAARGQTVYGPLVAMVDDIAHRVGAFHWPIEFPHVFARGGFDAVIGNPPWEVSQLGEQEYFAARSPEIAAMAGDSRKRAIARLENANPRLWADYVTDKRVHDGVNEFFRGSGRYRLTAVGKLNTYSLFAEHFVHLIRPEGRAGVIVPTGIATDSSTSAFFRDLIAQNAIRSLYSFYEVRGWFKGTDDRKSFCVLCLGAGSSAASFCFDIESIDDLQRPARQFTLTGDEIAQINPNTRTAPVFRSRADAELTAKLYRSAPVLIAERPEDQGGDVNPWGMTFQQGLFNMAAASALFRKERHLLAEGWTRDGANWTRESASGVERRVPLYEAKMIHQFDHRWATYIEGADDEEGTRDVTLEEKRDSSYEPSPRYWVPETDVKLRASRVPASLKRAWRESDVARCLKSLAEMVIGYIAATEARATTQDDLVRVLGRGRDWRAVFGVDADRFVREPAALANGTESQRDTPLTADDIAFLIEGPADPLALGASLIDRKQPRWLMGWRDIALRSVERTVIASVFPKVGVNHKVPIFHINREPTSAGVLVALFSSLVLDYVARQKIGGTSLTYFYLKQFPILLPQKITEPDLSFVVPRVLELTYTSFSMRPWAEDLNHAGPPFVWDEDRRATLRADLDAFFARKYGLRADPRSY